MRHVVYLMTAYLLRLQEGSMKWRIDWFPIALVAIWLGALAGLVYSVAHSAASRTVFQQECAKLGGVAVFNGRENVCLR